MSITGWRSFLPTPPEQYSTDWANQFTREIEYQLGQTNAGFVITSDMFDAKVTDVQTLAEMKALTDRPDGVLMNGRTAAGDGGGGLFYWVEGSTATADDALIVQPDGGLNGRWFRIYSGPVNIKWFGANSDGVTNSTTAFQAAMNTGESVYVPEGRYLVTGTLTFSGTGQSVLGNGQDSVIVGSGGFNLFTMTGDGTVATDGWQVRDLSIEGYLLTSGYLAAVNNASRVLFENINVYGFYNGFSVTECNVCTWRDMWMYACRGTRGFYLFANAPIRSDVMTFENITVGADLGVAAGSRYVGLYIDGMVNTIDANALRFVLPLRGVYVINSYGGSFGDQSFFGAFNNLQVDFPYMEGVYLDDCFDYKFINCYVSNGYTEEAYYIGANAVVGTVHSGLVNGNAKEAIVVAGKDWNFTAIEGTGNSWSSFGLYSGVRVASTAERIKFSACHIGNHDFIGATTRYGLDVESGAAVIEWSGGYLNGVIAPWRDSTTRANNNFSVTASGSSLAVVNNFLMGTAGGFGCTLTPTIAAGQITAVAVATAGEHYSVAPSVFAFDPTSAGSGFVATANISTSGTVTSITVSNPGSSYASSTIVYVVSQSITPTIWPYTATNIANTVSATGNGFVITKNDNGTMVTMENGANTVNYVRTIGSATGTAVSVGAGGTDTNINLDLFAKGTGAVYGRNTDGLTFLSSNQTSSVNYMQLVGTPTTAAPLIAAVGSDTSVTFTASGKGNGAVTFYNGQGLLATFNNAASTVNYLEVTAAATGNGVLVTATGSDTNVKLRLYGKGNAAVDLGNGQGLLATFTNAASTVNYVEFTGTATGSGPRLAAIGSDTNIDLRLYAKGTGVLDLGTTTAATAGALVEYIYVKVNGTLRKVPVYAT